MIGALTERMFQAAELIDHIRTKRVRGILGDIREKI
jgi:hypothetical protein